MITAKNKKSIALVIAVFGFLWLSNSAHAFELLSQEVNNATTTQRNMVTSDVMHFYQSLGTGLSGTITSVTFENKVNLISGTPQVAIWSCNGNDQPVGCAGATTDAQENYSITSTSTVEYTVTFSSPPTLNSSRYYYIAFSNDGATVGYSFSGSSANTYANGECLWMNYPSASIACGGASDIYFLLESNEGVSFLFPTNTTSYLGDFNSFWLNYGTTSGGEGEFIIYYATSSANLSSASTRWEDSNGLSIGGQVDFGQISVSKSTTLPPGDTYYAKAYFYLDDVLIGSSAVLEFSISGTGFVDSFNKFIPTDAPISTSTDLTITCDPDSGLFQRSFCKLFQYLFVPPPDSFEDFTKLRGEISAKPPFGYIAVVTNALSSSTLSGGTSTTTLGAITSFSIFSTLKTGLSTVLYIMLAFYIFNRFKKFYI